MANGARPAARLKLAHFGPLRPATSPLVRWSAALLPELVRAAEVGVFLEGGAPDDFAPPGVRIHDLTRVHWRNSLFVYDLAIYELIDHAACDFVHDAVCSWPGIVVLHDDDPCGLFARAPRVRRAVLEHSLALVVRSPSLGDRLRASEPWTDLFILDDRRELSFAAVANELLAICGGVLARRGSWVEELLETACAEMPSFPPGDPGAPWRAAVDELSSLGGPASDFRESSQSSPGRLHGRR